MINNKIKDTTLAKHFNVSSATVGNWRKSEVSAVDRYKLYMAMLEAYKKEDYPYVDAEYFIKEDDRYIIYKTIRDKQPLFAMFAKHDYSVSSLSVELEDDVDAIREVVKSYDELWN